VLLCSGYMIGRTDSSGSGAARAEAVGGVAFLAHLAELNDLAALRRHCERNTYQQAGRRVCDLPPVWISGGSR
jgi:hypothetical protein